MTYYSVDCFTWCKDSRSYVAEASDFSGVKGPELVQMFPDSSDLGFTLVTEHHEEIKVYLSETKRDGEGDIQYWNFVPVDRKHNFTVKIFND